MGVDTNITVLLAIKAKILQNTEILTKSPAAILNHDVSRLMPKLLLVGIFISLYIIIGKITSNVQS